MNILLLKNQIYIIYLYIIYYIFNIPNKTSYGTFIGEIFRICKSSTKYIDFVNDVKLLVNKLINQKFNKNLLYSCLNKFLNSVSL